MQYIWILIHRLYQIINTPQKLYFSQNMFQAVFLAFLSFLRGEKRLSQKERKRLPRNMILCFVNRYI